MVTVGIFANAWKREGGRYYSARIPPQITEYVEQVWPKSVLAGYVSDGYCFQIDTELEGCVVRAAAQVTLPDGTTAPFSHWLYRATLDGDLERHGERDLALARGASGLIGLVFGFKYVRISWPDFHIDDVDRYMRILEENPLEHAGAPKTPRGD